MKKIFLLLTAAAATLALVNSCQPKEEPEYEENAFAKVSQANLIDAAAAAYATWEDETVLPETLTVEGEPITKAQELKLTKAQYNYALAKVLVDLAAGTKDDVIVLNYKPADHPDRDSYDKAEIPVTGGAKIAEGTEDLADMAKRFVDATKDKGTVPNQTLITRDGEKAIAFSTNRLMVSLLRTLAEYKKSGSLPKNVSTDYLSAAATLKGFAQQFVGILDIWNNTVGTVSADGSHCTDNNSAWQNVHFVPIPHSGGAYADGVDQYDAKYQPYFTVTIDGTTYTSAQTWGIALRGIMDLITKEGSSKMQENRNPMEHTMGNGASLKEPIPAVSENDIWGMYPWYESTNDGPAINLAQFDPYLIVRCAAWFLTRQAALGKIGNYQLFCTDPDEGFVEEGVSGFVSSMRMWLIAARFYKYLLDNNITENVYDAVKDVKFDTDLYGVEMPDIELKTKSVTLDMEGTAVNAKFIAKKAWTAVASEPWIHVDPASGDASDAAIVGISADPNTGAERTGVVTIKGGNVQDGLEIAVTQSMYIEPASATLKEFAQEFVKGLDVWEATVGTVESESQHLIEKGTAWENVHFIPVGKTGGDYDNHPGNQHDDKYTPWTLMVNGTEYTSAQAWEIAIRGLLDMVLTDGQGYIGKMTSRNKPGYTLGDNKAFSEITIATPSQYAIWGNYPWYEEDGVTYNGEPLAEAGIDVITKATLGHLVRGLVGIPGVFDPLGKIGNFQEFGTTDSSLILEGYSGLISPMRELILMLRFYKYLLDNNIDKNVYSAIKDVKFDYDMYGIGVPEKPKPTIAEFAKEFAKAADKWENTVGTVKYTRDDKEYKYERVHYIPEDFVITLNGTNYNKYQMHEMAMRAFKAIENGGSLTDPVPEPGNYTPASSPYHEYEDPLQEKVAHLDFLSNFATRCLNYLGNYGEWPNACGYPRTTDPVLTNYNGTACIERNLIMLARLYKYVVDNNITSDLLKNLANVEISTELWGQVPKASIADFAQQFVKVLDAWDKNTGDVTPSGANYSFKGVHIVPADFTITVAGETYNKAQMNDIAMRIFKSVSEGGKLTDEMPAPATNTWGPNPYVEGQPDNEPLVTTKAGLKEDEVGLDLVAKYVGIQLGKTDGSLGRCANFVYITDTDLKNDYQGYCSLERGFLILARMFKYVLQNGITDFSSLATAVVSSDLYGEPAAQPTIAEFAKEYVKILDIWEKTTGEVVMHPDVPEETVANAHYVPSNTTITVGGKTYNTADMWETALRSYLLIRGYNGLETEKYGKNSIPALEGGAVSMYETTVPETHEYYWGSAPFNETKGNGGHLVMGTAEDNVHCQVKTDILDNWAMRSLNFQHGQSITNLCGYAGGQLDGYYGCFCSQRALLTYAFFFKYMLDNGLAKGTEVGDNVIIRSELLGDEGPKATIKDFAKEYVKILDIWEKTTGEVVMHPDVPEETVANAHYVPSNTTITVGGKTYNTADMWETALRSYLLIRGYNGLETEKYGKNSIPALEGGAVSMSSTEIPPTHEYYWGSAPFNETKGNGGHLVMGTAENNVHCQVKTDILDNWAMRSLNYQHGQSITNLCGYAGGQLDGYYGCFCSQRALLTYAFFFKYMLDNGLDKGTEVGDNVIIRSELMGDESGAADVKITIDGNLSEWDGIEGVEAGSFKMFKYASDKDNVYFYFKIKRSNIIAGKTEPFEFNWRRYIAFGIDTDNNAGTGAAVSFAGMDIPGCEAVGNFYPFRGHASEASGTDGVEIVNGEETQGGITTDIASGPDGAADKVTVFGQVDDDFVYLESKLARSAIGSPAAGTAKIQLSLSWDLTEIMDLPLN